MTKSRINNPQRMKQLIDFQGLAVDEYIYPTDVDGLIEYKDSEYIIFEVKYGDAEVPFGQKLALQRMVDDFTKTGKQAVVFVCEHTVRNPISQLWLLGVKYERYIMVAKNNGENLQKKSPLEKQ